MRPEDEMVEKAAEQLYNKVMELGGDPETLELISWDTETNVEGNPGVTIQKFTYKKEEK